MLFYFSVGEEDAAVGECDNSVGGSACVDAADSAGIEVVYAVFVTLYRRMGMPEKNKVGVQVRDELFQSRISVFYVLDMTVGKDDSLTAEDYRILQLKMGELRLPITVSAYCKLGDAVGNNGEKISYSIA